MISTFRKKTYKTPRLLSVKIDQEFSLVMMTAPPGNPSPPVPKSPQSPSGQSNPFGGNNPDYSKM